MPKRSGGSLGRTRTNAIAMALVAADGGGPSPPQEYATAKDRYGHDLSDDRILAKIDDDWLLDGNYHLAEAAASHGDVLLGTEWLGFASLASGL